MSRAAHWKVLPHDPIARLEENLWTVEGNLPGTMPMRRRMSIVRLGGGRLLIHNGIALNDSDMRLIEAWGEPAVLVVPNGWHRLDAPAYKERYKNIRVFCPTAARSRVEQVVSVDGTYDALPADGNLRVEKLAGTRVGEAVFVVTSPSGHVSLIFNDILFNMQHQPGLKGALLRLLGSTGGPRVTAFARLAMVRDKRALGHHLRQLAQEPHLYRLLVSHGGVIEWQGREALELASRSCD